MSQKTFTKLEQRAKKKSNKSCCTFLLEKKKVYHCFNTQTAIQVMKLSTQSANCMVDIHKFIHQCNSAEWMGA